MLLCTKPKPGRGSGLGCCGRRRSDSIRLSQRSWTHVGTPEQWWPDTYGLWRLHRRHFGHRSCWACPPGRRRNRGRDRRHCRTLVRTEESPRGIRKSCGSSQGISASHGLMGSGGEGGDGKGWQEDGNRQPCHRDSDERQSLQSLSTRLQKGLRRCSSWHRFDAPTAHSP